jgi:hypothetical protein
MGGDHLHNQRNQAMRKRSPTCTRRYQGHAHNGQAQGTNCDALRVHSIQGGASGCRGSRGRQWDGATRHTASVGGATSPLHPTPASHQHAHRCHQQGRKREEEHGLGLKGPLSQHLGGRITKPSNGSWEGRVAKEGGSEEKR